MNPEKDGRCKFDQQGMKDCIRATCEIDIEYFQKEFKKGFTHPDAKVNGLHPELLDCSDTIPASDTTPEWLVGLPKLGGDCFIKCRDGYKFAEFGENIGVGSGWDDQGRLKITCRASHKWGHNGDFYGPIEWNVVDANCYLNPWTYPLSCQKYPQCIPDDVDP